MAYTFFLAKGYKTVGTSLKEEDWVERAAEMLKKAEDKGVKILLPIDNVVTDDFAENNVIETVASDQIPEDRMGMDIGPKTEALYAEAIKGAKTVFWNGPMGVFEKDAFAHGTEVVARAVADSDCTSIIGGGDSVAAINKFGLADKMSWISTGGGASMELVEGKALPGVEALLDA
jgi:phosphoglycerate kinase